MGPRSDPLTVAWDGMLDAMDESQEQRKAPVPAADSSCRLLACQYLSGQLDALVTQMAGVRRNEDVEPVHQARVASRRLRVALGMFADCFDAKRVGRWRKRIRRLTRGLGPARDLDVHIIFVEGILAGLDEKDRRRRPGIERLLLRLRQDREDAQPKVLKTLDALNKGDPLAEMHGEIERTRFLLRTQDVPLQGPVVFERAAAHILRRKQDLLAAAPALSDPEDVAGHHRVRIAAKKLRYTMEVCVPAFDKRLSDAIKTVKKVQSFLGDVHDCDVWIADLATFIERERDRTVAYFGHARPFHRVQPGLEFLRAERADHRRQVFAELVEYWRRLGAERFWDDLEAMLNGRADIAQQPNPDVQDEPTHGEKESIDDHSPAQ